MPAFAIGCWIYDESMLETACFGLYKSELMDSCSLHKLSCKQLALCIPLLRTCMTVLRVVALFQSLESSKHRMMYSCKAAARQSV
jgi:hypothetical protein